MTVFQISQRYTEASSLLHGDMKPPLVRVRVADPNECLFPVAGGYSMDGSENMIMDGSYAMEA